MLNLEIRAAIYALLAGLVFFGGWHVKGSIDEGKAAEIKVAQDKVVEAQQAQNFAQVQQQATITAQVSQSYEQKLQAANASTSALSSLVRQYEAKLRSGAVSQVPAASDGSNGTSAIAGGGSSVDAAATAAIGACQDDAAQLQALIDWVNQQSQVK